MQINKANNKWLNTLTEDYATDANYGAHAINSDEDEDEASEYCLEYLPTEEMFAFVSEAFTDKVRNQSNLDNVHFMHRPKNMCNACTDKYEAISMLIVAALLNWEELCTELKKLCKKRFNATQESIQALFSSVIDNFSLISDYYAKYLAAKIAINENIALQMPMSLKLEEKIEKHSELNPKLWTKNNKLKSEVAAKIYEIVTEFVKNLAENEINIKINDIILIGSNCAFNYNENSDLDIHIIADTAGSSYPPECASKLYSAYRTLFNKALDIDFYNIPVEIFVEDETSARISNGVYSVLQSRWLKEPSLEEIPEIDENALKQAFSSWKLEYDKIIKKHANKKQTQQDDKDLAEAIQDIEQYINDIYELRKNGLAENGEYSIGNLVFKTARNKNYLDKLKELKNELLSKKLSLESLEHTVADDLADIRQPVQDNSVPELQKQPVDYVQEVSKEKCLHEAKVPAADASKAKNKTNLIKHEQSQPENQPKNWTFDVFNMPESVLANLKSKKVISEAVGYPVTMQDNGIFYIYDVKESDFDRLLNSIKQLECVETVKACCSNFDLTRLTFDRNMPVLFTICGKLSNLR